MYEYEWEHLDRYYNFQFAIISIIETFKWVLTTICSSSSSSETQVESSAYVGVGKSCVVLQLI